MWKDETSDRTMEVKLPTLLGNYERQINRLGHREVSLPVSIIFFSTTYSTLFSILCLDGTNI